MSCIASSSCSGESRFDFIDLLFVVILVCLIGLFPATQSHGCARALPQSSKMRLGIPLRGRRAFPIPKPTTLRLCRLPVFHRATCDLTFASRLSRRLCFRSRFAWEAPIDEIAFADDDLPSFEVFGMLARLVEGLIRPID